MNRELLPNTTPVPNIVFDKIMATIKPGAFKVLMAIVRFTYGWERLREKAIRLGEKPRDRISLKQLQDMTGLSRQGVIDGIKALGKLLTIVPASKDRREANEYALNLDISKEELVKYFDQSKNLTSQVGSQQSRPSKIRSKANGEKRDHGIREFFDFWKREHEPRFGPYVFHGGKEGAVIKDLLAVHDISHLKTLALKFLQSDDPWLAQHGGYTIGVFASQINKLNSTNRAREAPKEMLRP